MKIEGDTLVPDQPSNIEEIHKLREGFQIEFHQLDKKIKNAITSVEAGEVAHMYNLVNMLHFTNGILDQQIHPEAVGEKVAELYKKHTVPVTKEETH